MARRARQAPVRITKRRCVKPGVEAYDYVHADPLNRYELDGKWSWAKKK
ncbi:hypothetical protein [Streptomyces halstedii]